MPTAEELKGGAVHYWIGKINKEEKAHEEWRNRAKEAYGVFFNEARGMPEQVFNLFYSTVQTLQARLYSKEPNPDVRRRYDASAENAQNDPQAQMLAKASKDAAVLVERALNYTIDTSPFFTNTEQSVLDFLVAGMGVPYVKYKVDVQRDQQGNPTEIMRQALEACHVPWSRFHWEPGKNWEDCDWAAIDDYLTRDEIKRQFNQDPQSEGSTKADQAEKQGAAEKYSHLYRVSTVWYRPTRTIYVIGWNFDEPLKEYRDELNLEGFYPFPRPMFANVKSNDLTPTPDYWFNKQSYAYINRLVTRIQMLTAQIKASGFYDAGLPELANVSQVEDGTLVPVTNLLQRMQGGSIADFSKMIAILPINDKVAAVRELQGLLIAEKARLDEVNGIADIVRGSSNANETLGAQQIKSNWASLRLAKKQGEVSRCMRDVFRIMAEIISEHFEPQSLYLMTGIQPDEMVMNIIKSDMGRTLAIDVESDSTVAMEDEAEKAQRLEMLNYMAGFVKDVLPAVQQGMLPGDLAKEMLLFALSSFKHGRSLEDALQAAPGTMQQLGMLTQQLQQQGQQIEQMGQALKQAQAQNAQAEAIKAQEQMQSNAVKGAQAQASLASTAQKAANDTSQNEIKAYQAQTDRIALAIPDVTTTSII